ncbi:MAG: DUF1217 domain-containing protein [Acetobacteraceae bacterium]
MSLTTSSINYAALFFSSATSGASGTASTISSMLAAVYGGGTAGAAGGSNPLTALQIAESTQTQQVALTAQQPTVQQDISTFTKAVQSATSVSQLLSNPTVMKVLLTASGLASQVPYTAMDQQILQSNPNDSNALVNQMTDPAWLAIVNTYNFATQGLSNIQNPNVISTITQNYAQQVWMSSLNQTTPGLSTALEFKQMASTLTSPLDVLGSGTAFNVITTAFNIPQQIVFQDQSAQEQAINAHVDFTKLNDPTYVNGILDQYMLNVASTSSSSSGQNLEALAVQAQGLIA